MKGTIQAILFGLRGGGRGRKVESEIIYKFDGMFQNIAH